MTKQKNKTSDSNDGNAVHNRQPIVIPNIKKKQKKAFTIDSLLSFRRTKRNKRKPPSKEDVSMTAHNATVNWLPVEYVVFKTQEERSSSSYGGEQHWTSKGNSVIHTISIGALLLFVICWELRSMGQVDFVLTGMKLLGVALLCMLAMIPNQSKPISPASRNLKLLFIYSCSWIIFLDFGSDCWMSCMKQILNTYPQDDTCIENKAQGPEEIMLQSRFENAVGDHLLIAPFRNIVSLRPEKNIGAFANKADPTFLSAAIPRSRFELSMDTGLHEDLTQWQKIIYQLRLKNGIRWNVLNQTPVADILGVTDGIANEVDDRDMPSLKIQASRSETRTDMSNSRNNSFRNHNKASSSTPSMKMSDLLRLIELHYIAGDNSMILIPIKVRVMLGIDATSMPGYSDSISGAIA
jgi:hypothetical protein